MKTTIIASLAALTLAFSVTGCLKDKVLEVVAKGETFADFKENHTSATWNTPEVIDLAAEVRKILEDNGYSLSDIKDAKLVGAAYGVTSFAQAHDWLITGAITVARQDVASGSPSIVDYSSQSVAGALGKKIPASLNNAGVDLINQALADFLAGADPVLVFTIENGSVGPTPPTPQDPIVFEWRAWITFHLVVDQLVENVPDPF
jgi:hypothetical protein